MGKPSAAGGKLRTKHLLTIIIGLWLSAFILHPFSSMDFDLEELYQTVVLDHSRKLKLDPATGKLDAVGFTGSGCSICMASTSLMTTKIKGRTREEAAALLHDFQSMITGQTPAAEAPKTLGDLRLLQGVAKFPQRIKCATLGWHALKGALAASGAGAFSLDNNDGAKF